MASKNLLAKAQEDFLAKAASSEVVVQHAKSARVVYTISENTRLEDLLQRSAEDTLVAGEVVVHRSENGLFNLGDLYEASGRIQNKEPFEFFRTEDGKRYLTEPEFAGEIVKKRGAGGGTWASKRIAYRYAAYLDSKFYDLIFDTFESVQTTQLDKIQEVAENLLHTGASTVKELALAYEQNELKQLEVDARTRERDEYRKSLRDTTSPFAARLRDSASKAAVELRKDLGQLRGNLNSAAQLLGIVDSSLERLRKSLPKDSSKQFEELVYARGYLEKALNLLTED